MAKIGVFDSGFGGLTILRSIVDVLPTYDYIYLGDNARAPYGSHSFEKIYEYTWECVEHLLKSDCNLVILACNTASARALRSIQQNRLSVNYPNKRVLGIIIPTAEHILEYTKTKHVGILATEGTVESNTYILEIQIRFPDVQVKQEACPLWVPIIENNEIDNPGSDLFVQKNVNNLLSKSDQMDAIVLGCTHYPLLIDHIQKFVPENINLISQGSIVANSLKEYLQKHPEIENTLSQNKMIEFYTTDKPSYFDEQSSSFFGQKIKSKYLEL